jgi:hypothetical protein
MTDTDKEYPILMYGKWLGKWDAIALVDDKKTEQELLEKGYTYEKSN